MANKVLVVVDYQNDFVDGTLATPGADKLDRFILGRVKKAIQEDYSNIIFTIDSHDAEEYFDTLEGKRLPILHCTVHYEGEQCVADGKGAAIYGKTGEFIQNLAKSTSSQARKRAIPDGRDFLIEVDRWNFDAMDNAFALDTTMQVEEQGVTPNIRIIPKETFGCLALDCYFQAEPDIIEVCGLDMSICVASNITLLRAMYPNAEIKLLVNGCGGVNEKANQGMLNWIESIQVDLDYSKE